MDWIDLAQLRDKWRNESGEEPSGSYRAGYFLHS
jgi:hypothetical protein